MNTLPLINLKPAETWARLTRSRFIGLLTASIGAVLGLDRLSGSAAQCRKKSARCDRSTQCCSKRCKRGFCYPRRRHL
jgi:hypothetical protein